ncbi:hypothetical protein ACFQ60_00300 [Streptomyces zhihengii]
MEAGREFLVDRARLRGLTTYTELNAALVERTGCRAFDFGRPDERAAMGHLLGLIVERDQERAPAKPPLMLSALVTYLHANDPGPGFYQLAKDLQLLPLSASKIEKDCFWARQVDRIQALHRD